MPSDEYTSIARGPLRLKGGAGVTKKKKKKDKGRSDLEKNLSIGSDSAGALSKRGSPDDEPDKQRSQSPHKDADGRKEGEEEEEIPKTEAERRFAEIKRKRVRPAPFFPLFPSSHLPLAQFLVSCC